MACEVGNDNAPCWLHEVSFVESHFGRQVADRTNVIVVQCDTLTIFLLHEASNVGCHDGIASGASSGFAT